MSPNNKPASASKWAAVIAERLGMVSQEDRERFRLFFTADAAGYAARAEWRLLLKDIANPHRLEHSGRKVYSQGDEDGIIQEIFRRLDLGPPSGKFVEFGVGNGLECNTHHLIHRGFSGVWLECDEASVRQIRDRFSPVIASRQIVVAKSFVTAENIDALLLDNLGNDRSVTLLSIDVDGNDFWIWKAIKSIAPAVVLVEYNGKFPPPVSIAQEYRPDHVWQGTDYFGASLEALCRLGREKGYKLVACSITGVNAFFVRDDLLGVRFPYELTATNLYHPCRYHLIMNCFSCSGNPPDFGVYIEVH